MKQKRKLRIFISNTAFPAKDEAGGAAATTPANPPAQNAQDSSTPAQSDGPATTCWELRVEGRLIDEDKKVKKMHSGPLFRKAFPSFCLENVSIVILLLCL